MNYKHCGMYAMHDSDNYNDLTIDTYEVESLFGYEDNFNFILKTKLEQIKDDLLEEESY